MLKMITSIIKVAIFPDQIFVLYHDLLECQIEYVITCRMIQQNCEISHDQSTDR